MKRVIIFSCLSVSLFADGDYVPLSELSDAKKIEYNFMNKKNIVEPIEAKKNNQIIQQTQQNSEIKEEVQVIKEVKNNDENFLKEFKKENILQDSNKENRVLKSEDRDFSITPKLTYMYLKTDIFGTQRVSAVDEGSAFLPEIALKYKNHTIKADFMESKAYFNNVLLVGSDLETNTKWQKFHYLYGYGNADFGLAYNKFDLDWKVVRYGFTTPQREEFPSLEINFKNDDNKLQALYGGSYGRNDNIEYAYEYYLNLGYRILNKDSLILSAGYKNKTIEFGNDNINEYRYQYKGPTLGLSSSF